LLVAWYLNSQMMILRISLRSMERYVIDEICYLYGYINLKIIASFPFVNLRAGF
jgi:hypothetical protein